MRELCCSIVSALVFRFIFVFSIFLFGVLGATLGAMVGAVIGWSNKMRFIQHVTIGIVSGTALSYKLTKATFDHLLSDNDFDEFGFVVHVVKPVTGDLEKLLRRDEHKTVGSTWKQGTLRPSLSIGRICLATIEAYMSVMFRYY